MLNPSELDGEVDHSFFDSDCDDGGEEGTEKMEKGLKDGKWSPAAHDRLSAKDGGNAGVDLSTRTEGNNRRLRKVENNKRSRASDASSVSHVSDRAMSDSSDGEDHSDLDSKRPSGRFLALVTDAQELDDAYNQKSFSSTDANADAESSCSSRRSNSRSAHLPKPANSSAGRGRRTSVSSVESQDLPAASTDEPDDTVTNLSSHESSLLSLNQNHTELETGSQSVQQNEESVTSSGLGSMHQEQDSFQDVDECSTSLESRLASKLVLNPPGCRNRKNYTFSNNEVWRIDRENQRLLRKLSRLSPGPRSAGRNTSVASSSPLTRVSHSALNRQRDQRRIEQENLVNVPEDKMEANSQALLKRLESVKPTPGLKRSEQLADYQRRAQYPGVSSFPVSRSSVRKERSSSRTSSEKCFQTR